MQKRSSNVVIFVGLSPAHFKLLSLKIAVNIRTDEPRLFRFVSAIASFLIARILKTSNIIEMKKHVVLMKL